MQLQEGDYRIDILTLADQTDLLDQLLVVSIKHKDGKYLLLRVDKFNQTYSLKSGDLSDKILDPLADFKPIGR